MTKLTREERKSLEKGEWDHGMWVIEEEGEVIFRVFVYYEAPEGDGTILSEAFDFNPSEGEVDEVVCKPAPTRVKISKKKAPNGIGVIYEAKMGNNTQQLCKKY